jgi:hypothetical protein
LVDEELFLGDGEETENGVLCLQILIMFRQRVAETGNSAYDVSEEVAPDAGATVNSEPLVVG